MHVFSGFAVPKFWDANNLSHTATMFAVCWDFDGVAATKTADTCRDCPHAQRCWDFLPRLMPQGHEWSSTESVRKPDISSDRRLSKSLRGSAAHVPARSLVNRIREEA